ncbi:hook-length control protein FliK [Bradyrhizobium lablabi]|uniref:Hook-length control protein FliK n=1 Tax=Bradyrhizobium lablabi TaxID=722472 RepID=A0A1M7DED1_9BRAD|nr:flagellar hook-length control protein FliK [Bradyrhizobium lablabi]SHL77815.1 hook-length control protein FliK [Bradyrhizobium lablabi]
MTISVNPTVPVVAAQSVASDLVLQPGTVVDAEVLKVLSDNLVRIAISSLAIDVLSEVPLQAGQSLQLAVSQTADGIRLAVVGPDAAAGAPADAVTLTPDAPVTAATASPPAGAAPTANALTPLERAAVSAAAAGAATQQDSLAPLFANLGVAATSNGLPPKLQQAVLQVLAQRTSLDPGLTGNDVKNAFQKSGILLEASLAAGSVPPQGSVPDLKAALIVLRQTLLSSLGTGDGTAAAATVAPSPATPAAAGASAADAASLQHGTATSTPSPSLSPEIAAQEILLPQSRVAVTGDPLASGSPVRIVLPETLLNAGSRTMTAGTVLNLLQETLQARPLVAGSTNLPATATALAGRNDDVTVHTNTPPPPFRGALPSAQPIATPSITANAPLAANTHHLLADTDAAIARQTLLQVASLPDRVDAAGPRLDPATPRWNFEIPFVTSQGTAMAQFEISRDGAGNEVEAAKRVWRARFSLDVEPAGPVHALVSLSGERTSVRMWAERPATVAQLRAGAAQLSQALTKAELKPGDIVIRDGTPPQAAPARAGHFLDRAL